MLQYRGNYLVQISKYWLVHFKVFPDWGWGRGTVLVKSVDINPGCIIRGTLINISAPQTPKRTRKIPRKARRSKEEEERKQKVGRWAGTEGGLGEEPSKRAVAVRTG